MDHHPPLPGLICCQCCVPLYYRSLPLSGGSAPVGCHFPTPWIQSQWIVLLRISTFWYNSNSNPRRFESNHNILTQWSIKRVCKYESLSPQLPWGGCDRLRVQLVDMTLSQPQPKYAGFFLCSRVCQEERHKSPGMRIIGWTTPFNIKWFSFKLQISKAWRAQ